MRSTTRYRGAADDRTQTIRFGEVPAEWQADVRNLGDFTKGIRAEFAQHLVKTINREPTEADRLQREYDLEAAAIKQTRHVMANGHTFVPHDDQAMEAVLKLAEANGGSLRSCWGILPLTITVRQHFAPYPNGKGELSHQITRVQVGYDWKIDEQYWKHCQERFASTYPKSMSKIAESVERQREER